MDDSADLERRQRQLETLDRLSQRFGASMSGAFARSAGDGRRLDTVLGSIGRSLANATARAALRPLQTSLRGAFEGLFRSALGGGSGAGGIMPFAAGAAFSRGAVTPFAQGGVVASPTYFPLARGIGLMGERGAEAVLPLARGADGRLGVHTTASLPVNVTVQVSTPDADSFRRSEAQVAAALARAVARGQRAL